MKAEYKAEYKKRNNLHIIKALKDPLHSFAEHFENFHCVVYLSILYRFINYNL